jgi:hypothetical protein
MMALFWFPMWRHIAPLTDAQLDWLESAVGNYNGPAAEPGSLDAILGLRKVSEHDRRQVFDQTRKPGTGPYPKEYAAPFLETHIGDLSILPVEFQASVLRIKGQIDRLNQHVVLVQKLHERTFDSNLSPENRDAVLSNLKNGYEQLGGMAKRIVDSISGLPTEA